jgi:hypothetical protein
MLDIYIYMSEYSKTKTNNDSDTDEDEISQITKEEEKKFITSEFRDTVMRYMKIDDLIKKRNEDIKELKMQKKPCEEQIIKLLEKQNIDFIQASPGQTLTRKETLKKEPIKAETIKKAIIEGLETNKIVTKEEIEKANKMAEEILEMMEQKRAITKKVSIVRTIAKDRKKKLTDVLKQ